MGSPTAQEEALRRPEYLDTVGVRGSNPLSRTPWKSSKYAVNQSLTQLARTFARCKEIHRNTQKCVFFWQHLAAGSLSLSCGVRQSKEIDVPEKICYTRVEPREGRQYIDKAYIFISEGELDQDVGALCDKFENEHIARVFRGQALLVDLRGKEPRFESVPLDYKLSEQR
jgi:hypothetical protein